MCYDKLRSELEDPFLCVVAGLSDMLDCVFESC